MPRRFTPLIASHSKFGCYFCKKRRKKCDEMKPTCSSCLKRSIECVYPENVPSSNTKAGVRKTRKSGSAANKHNPTALTNHRERTAIGDIWALATTSTLSFACVPEMKMFDMENLYTPATPSNSVDAPVDLYIFAYAEHFSKILIPPQGLPRGLFTNSQVQDWGERKELFTLRRACGAFYLAYAGSADASERAVDCYLLGLRELRNSLATTDSFFFDYWITAAVLTLVVLEKTFYASATRAIYHLRCALHLFGNNLRMIIRVAQSKKVVLSIDNLLLADSILYNSSVLIIFCAEKDRRLLCPPDQFEYLYQLAKNSLPRSPDFKWGWQPITGCCQTLFYVVYQASQLAHESRSRIIEISEIDRLQKILIDWNEWQMEQVMTSADIHASIESNIIIGRIYFWVLQILLLYIRDPTMMASHSDVQFCVNEAVLLTYEVSHNVNCIMVLWAMAVLGLSVVDFETRANLHTNLMRMGDTLHSFIPRKIKTAHELVWNDMIYTRPGLAVILSDELSAMDIAL
ncbi:hypothetical protein CANCADRAFT_144508 [Tortispora caseinolytica NRRL Y-17796]|uniref:Zn(2)-C6 fungal-type domain-containing protein n=1 Tax=Tortispora caseinolytica NRRL Y-17796 TaxID=767744 RepID=A0A1E4TDL3_9ASCO|nr:hypothetical protein CANCADRAFT_144508 [Tortispora caseinolytica NRRL Y-17796]